MTTPAGKTQHELWVFGYGSLMWRPGFVYDERHTATLQGWRRRLCVYSHFYRGTAERPGLVFGLDQGGSCHGVAFRVEASLREATVRYLREREQVSSVYLERTVPITLSDGRRLSALTYVADRAHEQYAGSIPRDRLLGLVRQGVGRSGDNTEYVLNTRDHLRDLGIIDVDLEWLASQLRDA